MSSCEKHEGLYSLPVSFDLSFQCHNVIWSIFVDVVSPIVLSDEKAHRLTIEDTSFSKIYDNTIKFANKAGEIEIRRTCICSGKGFLDRYSKQYGMAFYAVCSEISYELSSFSYFDGYGKISNAIETATGEMKHFNESLNRLSDYISFYLGASEVAVSYFSLANSTGATNGIEFNGIPKNQMKYANFIRIVVFALLDVHGNSPGLVVVTNAHLDAQNLYFADCKGDYFISRASGSFSLTNIYSDDQIKITSSLKYQNSVEIGPNIKMCNNQQNTCKRSNKLYSNTLLLLCLLNYFI